MATSEEAKGPACVVPWTKKLSNEKRVPGCLGHIGDEIPSSYVENLENHEIRILIKQPVFHGK